MTGDPEDAPQSDRVHLHSLQKEAVQGHEDRPQEGIRTCQLGYSLLSCYTIFTTVTEEENLRGLCHRVSRSHGQIDLDMTKDNELNDDKPDTAIAVSLEPGTADQLFPLQLGQQRCAGPKEASFAVCCS